MADLFARIASTFRPAPAAGRVHQPLLAAEEIVLLLEQTKAFTARRAHRREVHQRFPGDARSIHLGRGLDFEESRPYQPGDDIRDMDWRTTARIGKPYLKVYREEHHPMLHVIVDRGASMRFGTKTQLKAAQAARVAALAAFASVRDCACIGGTLVEAEPARIPCQPGHAGALRLVETVAAPCPPETAGQTPPVLWHDLLLRLVAEIPRGSRIVFVSDLGWLGEAEAPALRMLSNRHDLTVFQVLDPAELRLPNVGTACFYDPAANRTRWIDTASRAVRQAFAREADGLHEQQRELLYRCAVVHRRLRTDEDVLDRMEEFVFHE